MYNEFEIFGKRIRNICWVCNYQKRSFCFFSKNMKNCYLHPQVVKSILRWSEIKYEEENRYEKLGVPSSHSDFDGRSRFIPFWTSRLLMGANDRTFIHWLIEENVPDKDTAMNKMKNILEKSQQYWKV